MLWLSSLARIRQFDRFCDGRRQAGLKLLGWQVSQCRVQSIAVIHLFNETADPSLYMGEVSILQEMHLLVLSVFMKLSARALSYGLPLRDMLICVPACSSLPVYSVQAY